MRLFFLFFLFASSLLAKERIVSLSPSLSEIVYALESGEDLVATSEFSLYPKEVQKLPTIGTYSNPHVEKILQFRPSLVLAQEFHTKTAEQLRHFGIKTLVLELHTLQNIQNSIKTLGMELGKQAEAAKILQTIEDAKQNAPKTQENKKVLLVYGLHEDLSRGIYVAGGNIFFDDIIELCGASNAYKGTLTSQPVLSYEHVIALNPDQIIILHSPESNPHVDKQKALQNWYALPTNASTNNKITVLEESYLHIPSHRVVLTIERLCREIKG